MVKNVNECIDCMPDGISHIKGSVCQWIDVSTALVFFSVIITLMANYVGDDEKRRKNNFIAKAILYRHPKCRRT